MPVKIAFQQGRVREGKGCASPRGAAPDKVFSASEPCEAAACGTAASVAALPQLPPLPVLEQSRHRGKIFTCSKFGSI
jgi:hypothetical protein